MPSDDVEELLTELDDADTWMCGRAATLIREQAECIRDYSARLAASEERAAAWREYAEAKCDR